MPGPPKKDPSLVARRNKPPAKTVLKQPKDPKVPELPKGRRWYSQVRDWWTRQWTSPMAAQWTESDRDAMFLAAMLWQQFWDPETSASTRNQTAAQIRAISDQLGLSPMARNRLGWEIEEPPEDDDGEKTPAKRASAAKKSAPAKEADPRKRRLHAVS
jgi:hypothetical protein